MQSKKVIGMLCSILLLLTGCKQDKTAVTESIVQAYDTHIALDAVHKSATNVAVQYANYMRNGYYDAAYDLVFVSDGVFYTKEDMQQVDMLSELTNKYILTDVTASSSSVILTYREKIGEAYTPVKKETPATYIGEVCTTEKKIVVPVVEYNGAYYVDVNSDYMSTEQIALKVPDNCSVWFGDVLLDSTKRDDNGYYILSEYLATGYKTVQLSSAVEDRKLLLILDEEETEIPVDQASITVYNEETLYNGLRTFVYDWEVSRNTQEDALNFVKPTVQTLFDDVMNATDFYDSVTYAQLANCGNAESVKPEYMKLVTYYADTKSREYKDLVCVDVQFTPDDIMQRKGYKNVMLDNNIMQLHVELDYSYLITSSLTDVTTPHTGTVSGYIYLTKENGSWKLCNIEDRLLKNIR